MGLFGFLGKAAVFAGKTALSKVTGGVSDKVFASLKATKALKSMVVKNPEVRTSARQAADLKYNLTMKLPKAGKPPSELVKAANLWHKQLTARRARGTGRAAAKAPRTPRAPRAQRGILSRLGESGARTALTGAIGAALGRGRRGRRTIADVRRGARVRGALRGLGAQAAKAARGGITSAGKLGAAGAGLAAFAAVRKTRAGGALGDKVVSAVLADKAARDQRRLNAFRAQVAQERAAGKVTSARVRQIAKQHGL